MIKEFVQQQYHSMKNEGFSDQAIAFELGISRMTIYNWRKKGILK